MRIKDLHRYPFELRSLSEEEGGGFLVSFTDFNECIADGDTVEEAIKNGYEALGALIETLKEMKMEVPEPGNAVRVSGKFVYKTSQEFACAFAGEIESRKSQHEYSGGCANC